MQQLLTLFGGVERVLWRDFFNLSREARSEEGNFFDVGDYAEMPRFHHLGRISLFRLILSTANLEQTLKLNGVIHDSKHILPSYLVLIKK